MISPNFSIDDELRNDLLTLKPQMFKFVPAPGFYESTLPDRWEKLYSEIGELSGL